MDSVIPARNKKTTTTLGELSMKTRGKSENETKGGGGEGWCQVFYDIKHLQQMSTIHWLEFTKYKPIHIIMPELI